METTVPVRVGGELVIKLADLPTMALELIKSALTVRNEAREKAAGINQFGWWELPEFIPLYRIERRRGGDEVICLPRGFASHLVAGLAGLGIQPVWDDQRSKVPAASDYYRPFVMRDYQADASKALICAEQGVYKCPSGGGKTVSVLGALATLGQRALIIVDKVGLANQWRVRGHQFYGMSLERDEEGFEIATLTKKGDPKLREVGLIGNGIWEERGLTVGLRQTLVERVWQMDATDWWATWGVEVLDEVHHASAEGLGDLSRKSKAHYFWGVSATPAKSEAKGKIVNALVGPIVHETPRSILYERKVLMRPTVEVINGDFFAEFWPDHDAEYDADTKRWKCLMPGCNKTSKKHSHRNNYSSVLKKLVEDKPRAQRIADRVMAERGHVHLLPSRQLKHLTLLQKTIEASGWPKDKIWMLRGEENAKGMDQQIVQEILASDEGVILSTVADEALDIPPIDRVHISFPMRDEGATIQLCGRCERICPPRKTDATIIDYREPLVDVLELQWGERSRVYRMQNYVLTGDTNQ